MKHEDPTDFRKFHKVAEDAQRGINQLTASVLAASCALAQLRLAAAETFIVKRTQ
jgi:hypothetical protein